MALLKHSPTIFVIVYTSDTNPIEGVPKFTEATLIDTDITTEDVRHHLQQMNPHKSPSPDWVHPLVIEELADTFAVPLATLFDVSLRSGVLPMAWKTTVVCPMYKSGGRRAPGDYRPVSLTSVVGKLMKNWSPDGFKSFLERNQLLSNSQHDFHSK